MGGPSLRRALDGLERRFVFVVGKGGVGKTTSAAALALGSADDGMRTHLVSTDPAHSLDDVLAAGVSEGVRDGVREGVCGAPLTVEAFDAASYYQRWLASSSRAIEELFELGTYLDREDVDSFLSLSLPGLDELMAALRLVDLGESSDDRIVVDTAPTGHALRLLQSGRLLSSWSRALRAMERKGRAVAEGLAHRGVRLKAEDVVSELEGEIRRFEEEVLRPAAFVVVSRAGAVVRRETEALGARLDARGYRVALRVLVGGPGGPRPMDRPARDPGADVADDVVLVPWNPPMTGCERLRLWGSAPDAEEAPAVEGGETMDAPSDIDESSEVVSLLSGRLVFFAGKGGVGKSTCASAGAATLAAVESVTLVSIDPAGSLEAIWNREVGADQDGTAPGDRLRLVQVNARREFDDFVERNRRAVMKILETLGVAREAELDRDVMTALLEVGPPGIDEIFALTRIVDLVEDGNAVIVDAAPTGHFLRLVELPDLALDWVHSLMKVLLKYRSVGTLDRTAEELLDIAKRLKALRALLRDETRCGVLLVTLDEPVVAAESLRLHGALEDAGVPVAGWIRNRSRDSRSRDDAVGGAVRSMGQRQDAAAVPGDGPVFVAPEAREPLRGHEALRAFASRWRRVA